MLTGDKPHYRRDSRAGPLPAPPRGRPGAVRPLVPGLAHELDELVARATARDPDARPHDAVALLRQTREARAALTDRQLDAVPPQALEDESGQPAGSGSSDRTQVIPRALPAAGVNRTSRLEMPVQPELRPARRSPRADHGLIAVGPRHPAGAGCRRRGLVHQCGPVHPGPLAARADRADGEVTALLGRPRRTEDRRRYSDAYDGGTVISSDPHRAHVSGATARWRWWCPAVPKW